MCVFLSGFNGVIPVLRHNTLQLGWQTPARSLWKALQMILAWRGMCSKRPRVLPDGQEEHESPPEDWTATPKEGRVEESRAQKGISPGWGLDRGFRATNGWLSKGCKGRKHYNIVMVTEKEWLLVYSTRNLLISSMQDISKPSSPTRSRAIPPNASAFTFQ